jgi:hypothetical protein
MMIEPRPCPVCGGTELGVAFEETDAGVTAKLICESCDEDVDTESPVSKPCDTVDEAEDEAVRVWNCFVEKHAVGG